MYSPFCYYLKFDFSTFVTCTNPPTPEKSEPVVTITFSATVEKQPVTAIWQYVGFGY